MVKRLVLSLLSLILILGLSFLYFENKEQQKKVEKKCKDLSYEDSLALHPKNFSSFELEVVFPSEKKWRKNIIKSQINAKNNKLLTGEKYYNLNQRVKANFIIRIPGKLSCKLKARIRAHGLLEDHRDGSDILPSLNVILTDGNIFGITKFILFRPKTRAWDNEIIVSKILKAVNYLSPRTTKTKLVYNNQVLNFIFQERIVKEFLEYNNLKEGPLYEGDNKFFLKFPKNNNEKYDLIKHKIINEKWSLESNNHSNISQEGLSILNKSIEAYTENLKKVRLLPADYSTLEKKYFSSNYFSRLDTYDSLNYALKAEHGLAVDDRTYYFDALYKEFRPVYWDGMSSILDRFNNINYNPIPQTIYTPSVKSGSSKALELIDSLNVKNLYDELKLHNVLITKDKLDEIKKIIKNNLINFNNFNDNQISQINYTHNSKKNLNKKNIINFSKVRLVFYDKNFDNYKICEYYFTKCKNIKFSKKEISKLLNQDYKFEKKDVVFVSKSYNEDKNFKWFHDFLKEKEKIKEEVIVERIQDNNILIKGNIKYEIDEKNKTLTFKKISSYGNVTFSKGKLENWTINFSSNNKDIYSGIDPYNLTGCLNFYDMEIVNLSLEIQNSNCEDAVNFVRSTGTINELKINKSLFDSLDADFSKLKFKKIFITKSINDCIDFSYGTYLIEDSVLDYCGDKGISVGELSIVDISKTIISNTNIGVASKDYSVTAIDTSIINNVKYCYSAYNKKIEFSGATLKVNNSKCKKNDKKNYVDKRSNLSIKNEL